MKPTPLRIWSGLISIAWIVGLYVFLDRDPASLVYFRSNFSTFSTQFTYLGIWLGIGLVFAIAGLRSGKSAGQICSMIAIGVFIYFSWHLFHPDYVPGAA
jgi:hypothetical protein